MDWTFIYLMFLLKIPIVAAVWIIYWAVKQEPDPASERQGDGDGGGRRPPHPRRPLPRRPRRGPHGDRPIPSPARVRSAVARSRTLER